MSAEGPLGPTVAGALRWSVLGQLLNRVAIFASGVVLARLLGPDDFGAYAVALVAVTLLMTVNELGVIPALVRWQGDVEEAADTGATVALGSSVLVYLGAFTAAPAFAAALGAPEASALVRVACLGLVVDGACAVPIARLMRSFREDRLAAAEASGTGTYVILVVGLALAGAGPWSIVWARLGGECVTAVLLRHFSPVGARFRFDGAVAAQLVRFGTPLALMTVVSQAALNVDYVVVGRVLGTTALGVYLLAFNLSSWPTNLITQAVGRVSLAGFSRLVGDPDRLRRAYPRILGVALSAVVPLVVGLALLAPELVAVVYGAKWEGAVVPLRLLVVLGGLRVVIDLYTNLLVAGGRPRAVLTARTLWLVVLAAALPAGARLDGLRGVGLGHLAVAAGVVLPLFVAGARRLGVAPAQLGGAAARPVLAGAGMLLAMVAVRGLVDGAAARLVVVALVGAAVYAALLLPRNRVTAWAWRQRRGRISEPAPVPT